MCARVPSGRIREIVRQESERFGRHQIPDWNNRGRDGARVDPAKNPVLRLFRRVFPVADDYAEDKFFVRREKLYATPLLLVLLIIETTDVIFAVDSIPAVLSITLNTFIVYTSNIFAILGLRSLFFVLSSLMDIFEYLHYGISGVLVFVGFKMLLSHYYAIRTDVSLAVIGSILLVTIVASALHQDKSILQR